VKFFDEKEEVLEIQLTQYGKYLLSKGKFRAKYYAFYDDDIIYDGTYAGYSETQNNIEYRIFNETPRTKTQYVYSGLETKMKIDQEAIVSNKDLTPDSSFQQTPEREYATAKPLSNSSLSSNYLPAMEIAMVEGKIDSTVPYETGSQPNLAIPQINLEDSTYEAYVDTTVRPFTSQLTEGANIFADGTYFRLDKENLLIRMEEKNALMDMKNFQIEFYIVEEVEDNNVVTLGVSTDQQNKKEMLIPLKFQKKKSNIKNGFISPTSILDEEDFEPTPNYVEYYFDIEIDGEIDVCEEVILVKDTDIFLGKAPGCEDEEITDQESNLIDGLYETDVDLEDLGEDC